MNTTESISPETTVKALFAQWPATIPVFLHHRMSCVGCCMSAFDTLAEVMATYQLDWLTFRSELESAIQDSTSTGQSNCRSATGDFSPPMTLNPPSQRISADEDPTITLNEPGSTTNRLS